MAGDSENHGARRRLLVLVVWGECPMGLAEDSSLHEALERMGRGCVEGADLRGIGRSWGGWLVTKMPQESLRIFAKITLEMDFLGGGG